MRKARCNIVASFMIAALFSGCAMTPLKPTASINAGHPAQEVALMLEHQADKCWSRRQSFNQDGITIDARRAIDGAYVISAARFAGDIGLRKPFFVVNVKNSTDGTGMITTSEGDYACSLAGYCFSLDYTKDVKRWVGGDLACSEKKEPWI